MIALDALRMTQPTGDAALLTAVDATRVDLAPRVPTTAAPRSPTAFKKIAPQHVWGATQGKRDAGAMPYNVEDQSTGAWTGLR
jgi:hypothetical protein